MPERISGKAKYYAQYTSSFAWSTYERDNLLLPYPSTFLILSQAWYSMSFLSAPSTTPSTPLKAGSSSKAQPQVGQVIELVSSDEDFRMSPPFPSFSVSHSLFHSAPTLSTPSRRSSRLASKVAKKVGRKGKEKGLLGLSYCFFLVILIIYTRWRFRRSRSFGAGKGKDHPVITPLRDSHPSSPRKPIVHRRGRYQPPQTLT